MPPKPRATRAGRAAPAADVTEATTAPATTILASPADKPHSHPAPADYSSGEDRVPRGAEYSESEPSEGEDGGYDSEDDPIVKEYDIYMTSELASSLYLFQYPVRAANKPYTKAQHSCPVDARLKSKAGLIEIDVPVNTAQNFDQEKGKIWGDALHQQVKAKEGGIAGKAAMGSKTGGKRRKVKDESDSEEETDTMLMDFQEALKKGRVFNKQTLGSKIQSDEARYMVGVFRDDQLHLTPLHHTLQLRPHFHHVDAQTSAEKNLSRSLREEDEPQKPVAAKAVHMTVNQETTQMTSTMKALRAEEEEIWKKLHWIDQEDGEAWDQYELLCLNDTESADKLRCSTTKAEYMDWLSGAKIRKTLEQK